MTFILPESQIPPVATRPPIPVTNLSPNKRLLSQPLTVASLKRKLVTFQPSTDEAMKRTKIIKKMHFDKLKVFQNLLDTAGPVCGFCLSAGVSNPGSHYMDECPVATPEQRSLYQDLRVLMRYPSGQKKPCYKCHIFSFGRNSLHQPVVRGTSTCTHPNLLLPLVFGIQQCPKLLNEARRSLKVGPTWVDMQSFSSWLLKPHPDFGSNCMVLFKWYSEKIIQ